MAQFPDFEKHIVTGTEPRPESGVRVRTAEDGTARGADLQGQDLWRLTVEYAGLTQAQVDQVDAFYDANRAASDVSITYRGHTYTGVLTGRPRRTPQPGQRYDMRVELVGSRA